MKSIKDVVVVWDRDSDNIRVLDRDVYARVKRDWEYSWGACNKEVTDEELGSDKLTIMVLAYAVELMVEYGCDKNAVNEALSKIKEYEEIIPIGFMQFYKGVKN